MTHIPEKKKNSTETPEVISSVAMLRPASYNRAIPLCPQNPVKLVYTDEKCLVKRTSVNLEFSFG